MDRAIGRLASRQHGVVGREQLTAMGIGRGAIEGRLMRGQLHAVHRGAYAVGHEVVSVEGRWLAACLAVGPQAVLSHSSAAQLWRFSPRSRRLVEVTAPRRWRPRPGLVVHRASIPDDEKAQVDGIPVTGLSRTLLDLAAVVDRRTLERAIAEAEVLRLTDRVSVRELLARYPRRRGTRVLRELLREEATARGVTRSELEERFVALVESHRLPRPRLNVAAQAGGRFFELDATWPDRRLAVELDGRAAHGTARAFERDRERDRLLVAAGWRIIRVTWRQLRDDGPAVADDLRKLLCG